MAPPEAATETTPEVVGVEVHVQTGGGDVRGDYPNNDKAVGASLTHDVGVGVGEEDVGGVGGGLKGPAETGGEGGGGGSSATVDRQPPVNKRKRNAKPFRIHLEPLSSIVGDETGEVAEGIVEGSELLGAAAAAALAEGPGSALVMASLGERVAVDKPNGRYNKNGVCFHKASNKWRAIVYVNKRQVNLGYFTTKEESEAQVKAAREHGLPSGFTNLRALQQPKRSEFPGVNWDKHCKRWLARVYEPTVGGKKGKEHKVGYFDDEGEAAAAVRARRVSLGLPVGLSQHPL